jgi:hypothetical protein
MYLKRLFIPTKKNTYNQFASQSTNICTSVKIKNHETLNICSHKIHCWCGALWGIDICACGDSRMVERMAYDGHIVHTDDGDGHCDVLLST